MFKVNPASDSESELVSDLKLGLISTGFICKIGFSASKYRVSRLKTRNRTRTRSRSRCSNQVRIGLGIGLEVQEWSVSDSKSSLENGDSGNSYGLHKSILFYTGLRDNQYFLRKISELILYSKYSQLRTLFILSTSPFPPKG